MTKTLLEVLKDRLPNLSDELDKVDEAELPTSCLRTEMAELTSTSEDDPTFHLLSGAFGWWQTPQGDAFWRDKYETLMETETK
jgi:hypothetical protein